MPMLTLCYLSSRPSYLLFILSPILITDAISVPRFLSRILQQIQNQNQNVIYFFRLNLGGLILCYYYLYVWIFLLKHKIWLMYLLQNYGYRGNWPIIIVKTNFWIKIRFFFLNLIHLNLKLLQLFLLVGQRLHLWPLPHFWPLWMYC